MGVEKGKKKEQQGPQAVLGSLALLLAQLVLEAAALNSELQATIRRATRELPKGHRARLILEAALSGKEIGRGGKTKPS